MEELLKTLSNQEFLISFLTVVTTVLYVFTFKKVLSRTKEKRESRKEKFFQVLIKGLEKETIKSHKDLINIYKGSTSLSTEDLSYRYGLNKWLRELLTKVIGESTDVNFEEEKTLEIVTKITEFIDNNEENSPFSDLPDTERNMLSDITVFIKSDDKDAANRKIKELSSVIQTRTEVQKRIETQNRWAIPLAVIGVVLTVTFGIISLIK